MPAIPASLTRELRRLRDATIPYFDLSDAALKRGYRRGGWNVRELLVHMADIEAVLLERLRRVAAQPKPLIMAIDPDAWADRLGYRTRDLGIALALFVAARSSNVELIERFRSDGALRGVHSEAGVVTLADIAERVRWHNAHHLEQLEKALGPPLRR